ncbi:MAG: NAD-glutamate dehydrogenase, partial [Nonlabens sp.]|nr:NAD-glutamate dehydrogenase [Nonlabens sp.]
MKFAHRLVYYLGGFSIGLVFLAFFLTGKRTQCTWFPEQRVLADIGKKSIYLSPEVRELLATKKLDTLSIQLILKYGDV